MNWDQARRILRNEGPQVGDLHGAVAGRRMPREGAHLARGVSVCIASGKGGTGKSVVSASLAALFAREARTLIVDADMGVGNAHILQDVAPEHSFVDLVEGRCSVRDILAPCAPNLDLLAAGSGVSRMASLTSWELHLVAGGIDEIEGEYARVVVDSAAGISNQTVALAAASDLVVLVTTPDVTALTDAYAFLKVLLMRRTEARPLFVVNRASSLQEGERVAERLQGVARKFLGHEPHCIGVLPDDRSVVRCVNARAPVVVREPDAPFSRGLREVFARIQVELGREAPRGLGQSLMRGTGSTPNSS
jgi:flagellar biosynthesis protein FlhG